MSFPVHADTYTIGKRRYRRNPFPGGGRPTRGGVGAAGVGDTADLYEDDELDDGPSCAIAERVVEELVEETTDDATTSVAALETATTVVKKAKLDLDAPPGFEKVEEKESEDPRVEYDEKAKKWHAKIYVPAGLMGKFVGFQQRNRKTMEESTSCRIKTPERGKDGDVEISSTVSEDCVSRCLDRIEIFNTKARATMPFTHFATIPLLHTEVAELFALFKEEAKKFIEDLDEEAFMNTKKLHLTVCMLRLFDKADEEAVKQVFDEAVEQAKQHLKGEKLVVDIQGLCVMNDDPTESTILYAEVKSASLQPFCEALREGLQKSKMAEEIKGDLKLHLSLIRTDPYEKKRVKFDATKILEEHKDWYFGTVVIDHVALVHRQSSDQDGFYRRIHSSNLYDSTETK